MDTTRMGVLAERYGIGGCIKNNSLLQAFYSEITGIDDDLDEDDFLWLLANIDWCDSSQATGLKRARILEVTSGDTVRVMSCSTTACLASYPNSYLAHLYGVNLPDSGKELISELEGQVVDIKEKGVNDTLGIPEIIVYYNDKNINDSIKDASVEESDSASIVHTGVYTITPSQLIPGESAWLKPEFQNVGKGRGEYKYYIGALLTDRDGTTWTYEGDEKYAMTFEAGEKQYMRANFTVPAYMDAPIAWKILLYKVFA